jgi:predicted  nucleic acid-binding Zn-ribbon protein
MTDAWDSNAVLSAAVKRAQKRKVQLRQELLAVRREREGVRREMEGVRQAHERGEGEIREIKKQQDFISEMEELKSKVSTMEGEDQVKVFSAFVVVLI